MIKYLNVIATTATGKTVRGRIFQANGIMQIMPVKDGKPVLADTYVNYEHWSKPFIFFNRTLHNWEIAFPESWGVQHNFTKSFSRAVAIANSWYASAATERAHI